VLAELKAMTTKELQGIEADLVSRFKAKYDERYKLYSEANEVMLQEATDKAIKGESDALAELQVWAFGTENGKEPFSTGLLANASLEVLEERAAQDKGLLSLDLPKLRSLLGAFVAAQRATKDAFDLQGKAVPEEMVTAGAALRQAAARTIAECSLLRTRSEGLDVDALRSKVKLCIQELRQSGLKEKLVLSPALYRWCYGAMTAK
jgi:fumarate hydratase class II